MRVHLNSIWVNAKGQTDALESIRGLRTPVDRVFALDTLGWVNICAKPRHIEVWLNPMSLTRLALAGAQEVIVDLLRKDPDRSLLMEVHDRQHTASLPILDADDLSGQRDTAFQFTSAPGYPLVHETGRPEEIWELRDSRTRDLLKFVHDRKLRLTKELVQRVDDSESRAKIVLVTSDRSVQYLAHDKDTQPFWRGKSRFIGRFLRDLAVPIPIKRSLLSDTQSALRSRQATITHVSGARQVIGRDRARCDSYFRLVLPLVSIGKSDEIPMLVLLARGST